ncbi:MAG: YraN family protein [Candidatus Omnitrophica bacterium]|nr:YraN family protein [Candidatus Omnitrophota bacterium]
MWTLRQQRGRTSEQLAQAYLNSEGYSIVATNVRFPVGELDIVAWEGETLCFVEVRSSRSAKFGPAAASVTALKQRHLIRAAQWYLKRLRRQPAAIRFDVVAIDWTIASSQPSVQLIRRAFDAV